MNADSAGAKLPPATVARATLTALRRRAPMALPGQTRMLPTLLRIAPHTVGRMVAEV
jgi:uncharacterized oxidoreductase